MTATLTEHDPIAPASTHSNVDRGSTVVDAAALLSRRRLEPLLSPVGGP
jgi:hypothetical protein